MKEERKRGISIVGIIIIVLLISACGDGRLEWEDTATVIERFPKVSLYDPPLVPGKMVTHFHIVLQTENHANIMLRDKWLYANTQIGDQVRIEKRIGGSNYPHDTYTIFIKGWYKNVLS